jgi:hypothetical protein
LIQNELHSKKLGAEQMMDRIFFWNMAQLLVLLPAGSGV